VINVKMKNVKVRVIWSLKHGMQSLHIPDTNFQLHRKDISIKSHRRLCNPFRRHYKVKILYNGDIIKSPVWNDDFILKILMAGMRMHETLLAQTFIEGIQVLFDYTK